MRVLMALLILLIPLIAAILIGRLLAGEFLPNFLLCLIGLSIGYGLARSRWWRWAAPVATISMWLSPLAIFLGSMEHHAVNGIITLMWYFLSSGVVFVVFSLRVTAVAAALAYGVALALNEWFAPYQSQYIFVVSLFSIGLFLFFFILSVTKRDIERERANAEESEHEARHFSEALTETAAILSGTLDLDEVLDRILEQVAEIVPSVSTDIMLIEDGVAHIVRQRGYKQHSVLQDVMALRLTVMNVPNLRRMIETGEPLLIQDTHTYSDWVDIPVVSWIRSELGAPIRLDGETIGFLNVAHDVPNKFTPTQARYLATFAGQAAVAIRNARLYNAARRYAIDLEKEVSERTAQLHLTHSRLRAILDATGEGIFYTEGVYIQYANAAMAELTGYSQQELIGMTLDQLRDPLLPMNELQQLRAMPVMIWKHGIWRGEARLQRKDGSVFYAGLTVSPMGSREQAAQRSVTLMRDISREKELALQKANFVAYASHELRTPITNLKTRLYLLRKRPEHLDDHLTVLEEVAERMKKLVEDLLDRTRLERGQINVHFQPLHLQALLRGVIEMQRPEAERKGLMLALEFAPVPLHLHADGERLNQVFTNLLTNAISYTPPGGTITVRALLDSGRVRVDVEDTGVGIASEHLPHIFEPFYRVMSEVEGTGLGLSLARQIVALHGGEIEVKSVLGKGSCFSVFLQIAAETAHV